MKKLLLAAICLSAIPGHAILAPLYQNMREIRALLNSQELIEKIPNVDIITNLECQEENITLEGKEVHSRSYLVTTSSQQFVAKVVYEPTARMGPRPFHFEFESLK